MSVGRSKVHKSKENFFLIATYRSSSKLTEFLEIKEDRPREGFRTSGTSPKYASLFKKVKHIFDLSLNLISDLLPFLSCISKGPMEWYVAN